MAAPALSARPTWPISCRRTAPWTRITVTTKLDFCSNLLIPLSFDADNYPKHIPLYSFSGALLVQCSGDCSGLAITATGDSESLTLGPGAAQGGMLILQLSWQALISEPPGTAPQILICRPSLCVPWLRYGGVPQDSFEQGFEKVHAAFRVGLTLPRCQMPLQIKSGWSCSTFSTLAKAGSPPFQGTTLPAWRHCLWSPKA